MPLVDIDVTSVPDIIEAQLTLSYSRLQDLIRVIVEQGNNHEDGIEELRFQLSKLARENADLRGELEALRQANAPVDELKKTVEGLKEEVGRLTQEVDEGVAKHRDSDAAFEAKKIADDGAAAQQAEFNFKMEQRVADAEAKMQEREASILVLKAFMDLWDAQPAQVLEMGHREKDGTMGHDVADRTTYLHTLPAFLRLYEEMDVVRAMMQKQAADALAAKTSEYSRSSRADSSLVAPAPEEPSAEAASLSANIPRQLRDLESSVRVIKEERLPPLEDAVRSQQAQRRGSQTNEMEKAIRSMTDRITQQEDRLNTLLNLHPTPQQNTGGEQATTAHVANLALADIAQRLSSLEEVVEGLPQGFSRVPTLPVELSRVSENREPSTHSSDGLVVSGAINTPAGSGPANFVAAGSAANISAAGVSATLSAAGGAAFDGGEEASGKVASVASSGRPTSRNSQIRPPAGRNNLPPIVKDGSHTPIGRSTSFASQMLEQPTVEVLRRQELSNPHSVPTRRISVAVEPDDGLRRRVAQLEENAAILEVNKADRRELMQLEQALAQVLGNANVGNGPSLVPQRPSSAGLRAPGIYGDGAAALANTTPPPRFDRPMRVGSSVSPLGRPVFVASGSVYLRDGAQLTNASVSPNSQYRTQ